MLVWHFQTTKYIYLFNKILVHIVNISNLVHGEVYSIQHYMTMLVSDLRQVGGFLRVLLVPPTIKLTATI